MKSELSFHSPAFNCGANSIQSANGVYLGDDVCRWLIRSLRERGIQTAEEPQQGDYCWSVTFHVADTGHVFSIRFWPNDRTAGDHWHGWVERQRGFVTSLLGGRKRGIRPDATFSSSSDIRLLEWYEPSKAKKIAEIICPTCGVRVVAYRSIRGGILVTSGAGIVLAIIGGVIGAAIGLATGGEAMPATIPGVAIGFVVGCGYGYVTSDKTLDRPKCPNCKQPIDLGFRECHSISASDAECGNIADPWTNPMRYNSIIPWRRHIFVDCGGNDGCSIRRFIKDFDPDGRFEMVTFEPNDLYATCYSDLPRHCLIQAAVHDRDGFQNFFLDRDDGDGSSLFGNKLTRENGGFGTLDTANPTRVRTIDLSTWLRQNTRTFDYVILKLDVEGAEYDILEKMIRDRTICRINHLFIEWHWDRVGVPHDRHLRLVRALERRRLPILEWDAQGY